MLDESRDLLVNRSYVSTGPSNLAGLRSNRIFESSDIDHTRDEISRILQPHALRPSGCWTEQRCHVDHVPVGSIGIGTIRVGNMHVHVPTIADYHLAILCLEGHARISVDQCQYEVGGRSALLVAPGEEMNAIFSSDCEQLFIRIARRQFLHIPV